jgi:hypothetical protein
MRFINEKISSEIPILFSGNHTVNLAGLLSLVFFDVFALPFLAVASASLYSKITREETQGTGKQKHPILFLYDHCDERTFVCLFAILESF